MLHTDIPTRGEIQRLVAETTPWSVTLYTPTEIDTAAPDANRIAFSNQARAALDRVEDRAARAALAEEFDDLIDDDEFWRWQSTSLVVLGTPDRVRTYRVPNRLSAGVFVGDRFHIKPLLRATTFPQTAFVLALAEGSVRLVEVSGDGGAAEVRVPELPSSAADHAGKTSLSGRAPKRRIQGTEGRKLRVRQYARAIDRALRDVLAGRGVPLILAATEPIDSLYRSVNSYPELLDESMPGNPEQLTDAELGARARELLDKYYADQLTAVRELFDQRVGEGRAATDLADIARAATFGMVDTLLVDIDATVPGSISAGGELTVGDASADGAPGVVDEICRRVIQADGRVLAVRSDDMPGGGAAAAILRYAPTT
ncbi:baeRF11 domain-containing protein [Nocardia farcinica]